MPVTAKLSRQFYERLGDEVANELVTWFNAVDEGYRQEFRDLFEAHFGRFEARLGHFVAETDVKLAAVEGRVNARLASVETRFAAVEQRLAQLVDRSDLKAFEDRIDAQLSRFEARLMRWLIPFWIGTVVALAGVVITALRVR